MAKEVTVDICMGTTCYLMGAAQLAGIAERFPAEWAGRVTVRGIRCEGTCHQEQPIGRAPFVRVDGKLISEADEGKVLSAIRDVLEA